MFIQKKILFILIYIENQKDMLEIYEYFNRGIVSDQMLLKDNILVCNFVEGYKRFIFEQNWFRIKY